MGSAKSHWLLCLIVVVAEIREQVRERLGDGPLTMIVPGIIQEGMCFITVK